MLTDRDTKHWAPLQAVTDHLCRIIPAGAKVLDVGPGHAPFARADASVDFQDAPAAKNLTKCDFAVEALPFSDKSFDVVYCRHVLEDLYNPFHLIAEMSRVGKAGYIETPSPFAELTRGVDGGSPPWRGYHHHRWIIWSRQLSEALRADELCFVSKFPMIEHDPRLDDLEPLLRASARRWNTYHLWIDRVFVRHHQNPLDFRMPEGYQGLLFAAAAGSQNATDRFFGENNIGS